VGERVGEVQINLEPQETPRQTPLDQVTEHATYEPAAVERYFIGATRAALALSEFRAPYRGRSTPVNASGKAHLQGFVHQRPARR
jgi:hypothetical protein